MALSSSGANAESKVATQPLIPARQYIFPEYKFTPAQLRGQKFYEWATSIATLFFFGDLAAALDYDAPFFIPNMFIIGHIMKTYGVAGPFAAVPVNNLIGNTLGAFSCNVTETLKKSGRGSVLRGVGTELVQYGAPIGGTLVVALAPKYLLTTPPFTNDVTVNNIAWGTLGFGVFQGFRTWLGKYFTITSPVPKDADDLNFLQIGNNAGSRILLSASFWNWLRYCFISGNAEKATENPYFTLSVIAFSFLNELYTQWCFTPDAFFSGLFTRRNLIAMAEEMEVEQQEQLPVASEAPATKNAPELVDLSTGEKLEQLNNTKIKEKIPGAIKSVSCRVLFTAGVAATGLFVASAYSYLSFDYKDSVDSSPAKPLARAIAVAGMVEGARGLLCVGRACLEKWGLFSSSPKLDTLPKAPSGPLIASNNPKPKLKLNP